ncbi:MAG: glycosyltransferase family 9 protein [Symploca sp. SIO2C1]|nr:glycosyltransferase family 9 protein [Symploca sp. SIO2C1]
MRILALVPGGIGDQILFFPTLDELKRYYPKADIDVIVEPQAKGAYRVSGSVDEVLNFDFKDRNGLADFANLLGTIRDREYDAVLSLASQWSIGLLLWMSGIPVSIGYKTIAGAWFLSNPVPEKTEQYAAHKYYDLLQGLDISSPCPEPKLALLKKDLAWAEKEQERLEAQDGYILIHGGSTNLSQTQGIDQVYPVKKWQQIIEDIQEKQPDLPIVLIQGPEDGEFIEEMLQTCPELKTTTPTDVGKLSAIIAGANLLLCIDSTPMYLAIAVGTYTIALFGSTEAKKLLPDNEQCVGLQSPTRWIADIKPEDVLGAIWNG